MKIIPISNPDELGDVAETILRNAMENPAAEQLIEQLINDPKATRAQLFATGFCMGAASAMTEWMQGNLIQVGNTVPTQGTS